VLRRSPHLPPTNFTRTAGAIDHRGSFHHCTYQMQYMTNFLQNAPLLLCKPVKENTRELYQMNADSNTMKRANVMYICLGSD